MNKDNTNGNDKLHGCHSNNHNPVKHMLHMILCCGIPVLIIFTLPFIAKVNPAVAAFLGIIAPFICPIMMGGMMFIMFKGGKNSKETDNQKEMIINEKESRKF
jgi:hypothetical protein